MQCFLGCYYRGDRRWYVLLTNGIGNALVWQQVFEYDYGWPASIKLLPA